MNLRVGGALALIILGVCTTILMGGPLVHFLDFKSALFVVGAAAGSVLLSAPVPITKQAFASWTSEGPLEPGAARRAAESFQQMGRRVTAAGLLGTVVGLVLMLQNMEDPNAIGPAMSVGLLTLLYGVILGLVLLRAMAASCLQRGGVTAEASSQRGSASLALLLASTFILLFTFSVLLLAMANFAPYESELEDTDQNTEAPSESHAQEAE